MRGQVIAARAVLIICAFAGAVLAVEILLRWFPVLWPHGSFGAARVDPELQLEVHAAAPIYNRVRWNRRTVNRDGFLDVDHMWSKAPGVVRVGFFGDSYVEAVQVPLDDVFFRRLPARIAGRSVEPFGFGISGWGTLHSLMAYRVMGQRYDLDDVVYLFVENDPGDNSDRMRRRLRPSAVLSDGPSGFDIRMPDPPSIVEESRDLVERFLLVARLLRVRLELLRMQRDAVVASTPQVPDANDFPSTWPPAILAETQALTRRILAEFRDEVSRDGRRFAVLYVPSGDREIDGTLPPADSWLPWLAQTCSELGIRLVDPRDRLGRQHAAGTPMYDDHWTPAAHQLIASVIAEYLASELAGYAP